MSKIVSVHSFRGGTGKSNITANLAASLYLKGKRVGIIDTDIQSPGIHVLFGLDETKMDKTMNDYLSGICSVEAAAYELGDYLLKENGKSEGNGGKIYLIPSNPNAAEIIQILTEGYQASLLKDAFDKLIESLELDYLFVDTHPGLNEETLVAIGLSDISAIVMRADYQDYQGTAVTVEICKELLNESQIVVIVNKVLPDLDFEALWQKIETDYQVRVAGILPESQEMLRLGSQGIFSLRYPEHPLTVAIEKLIDNL